jgi:hypothetical protein
MQHQLEKQEEAKKEKAASSYRAWIALPRLPATAINLLKDLDTYAIPEVMDDGYGATVADIMLRPVYAVMQALLDTVRWSKTSAISRKNPKYFEPPRLDWNYMGREVQHCSSTTMRAR